MEKFSADYWDERYRQQMTGWDIGHVSTPLKDYIDQTRDKSISILVPGAGNAYEVEYLHRNGFTNVWLLDFAEESIRSFRERCPDFPEDRIVLMDFFKFTGTFDLILEQTFFSSFHPERRKEYVNKCYDLLKFDGKLVGLLFGHPFDFEGPPYGGTVEEYKSLFGDKFVIETMEVAHNSIKPRQDRELFIKLRKTVN